MCKIDGCVGKTVTKGCAPNTICACAGTVHQPQAQAKTEAERKRGEQTALLPARKSPTHQPLWNGNKRSQPTTRNVPKRRKRCGQKCVIL